MAGRLRSLLAKLHPAVQAGLLSATAMSGGDVLAQKLHGQSIAAPVDWERTRRFGLVGFVITGPYFMYGYSWVDSVFKAKPPGISVALQKTALTHFTLVPVFISLLVTSNQMLDGKSLQQAVNKLQDVFLPTYLTGTFFWPFVQVINFSFIPTSARLVFINMAALVWNVYLSSVANSKSQAAASAVPQTAS